MRTQWLAVVLNLAAAAGALLLAPRFRIAGTVAAVGGTAVPGVTLPPPDRIGSAGAGAPVRVLPIRATPAERLLVAAYAVSGFTAMLYEVAWSRLLVLVLGSSTYSYTLMLATFLLGLAAGAWIGVRLLRAARDALLAVGLCQILVALTTWLSLFLVEELPYLYLLAHDHLHPSPRGLLAVQWALAAGLMLPPTLGLGAMFPVTVGGLAPEGGRAPRVVGWAYAWNTLGAIGGSIVAGFWLVPGPGTRFTLLAGIALNTLVALVAVTRGARSGAAARPGAEPRAGTAAPQSALVARFRRPLAVALVLFLINLALAGAAWNPWILSSGMFRYVDQYTGLNRAQFRDKARRSKGEILMFEEGRTCTVTVFRTTATLTLAVNGKPDASVPPGLPDPNGGAAVDRRGDLATEVLLAQLPMLLAPAPSEVMVIGLGSGVTLGSVLTHPVRRADCVELEDAVVAGSRWFDAYSGAPLDDPRARLLVNDARSQVALSGRPYDVIISEPSNPWTAGAAHLFTRDFFALARARLRPGGIFTQWVQLYEVDREDFLTLVRGFLEVFPETHLFRVGDDAVLVGSGTPLPVDLGRMLGRATPRVRADLLRVGVLAPEDLLGHYWIGGAELRAAVGPGPLNTDDNMRIEFVAPLRMLARHGGDQEARTRQVAGLFREVSSGLLPHVAFPEADARRQAAFWAAAGRAAIDREAPLLALAYAERSRALAPGAVAAVVHGEALRRAGREDEAVARWRAAAAEFPRDPAVPFALLEFHRARGEWEQARAQAEALRRLRPADTLPRDYLGEALHHLGDHAGAVTMLAARLAASRSPPGPPSPPATSPVPADGAGAYGGIPSATDEGATADLDRLLAGSLCEVGRCGDALAPLWRHLDRRPDDDDARRLLVRALRAAGREPDAVAQEKRFAPDAAARAAALLHQGRVAWEAGDAPRARALLEEARLYDPASDAIALALALARERGGDPAAAFALVQEVLRARPDTPWAVGFLGQLLENEGRAEEGRAMTARYTALTGAPWRRLGDPPGGPDPRL